MEPNNPHCQRILKFGLGPCVDLHEQTPEDVLVWIKDELNDYHEGSGFNAQEQYDFVPRIDASWQEYKHDTHITYASCPKTGEFRPRPKFAPLAHCALSFAF